MSGFRRFQKPARQANRSLKRSTRSFLNVREPLGSISKVVCELEIVFRFLQKTHFEQLSRTTQTYTSIISNESLGFN